MEVTPAGSHLSAEEIVTAQRSGAELHGVDLGSLFLVREGRAARAAIEIVGADRSRNFPAARGCATV